MAMVLEARCRFEDSFGRPPSAADGIFNFCASRAKPENFWQMDRPRNRHILWVSNTKSVPAIAQKWHFFRFSGRLQPSHKQGFWQERNDDPDNQTIIHLVKKRSVTKRGERGHL